MVDHNFTCSQCKARLVLAGGEEGLRLSGSRSEGSGLPGKLEASFLLLEETSSGRGQSTAHAGGLQPQSALVAEGGGSVQCSTLPGRACPCMLYFLNKASHCAVLRWWQVAPPARQPAAWTSRLWCCPAARQRRSRPCWMAPPAAAAAAAARLAPLWCSASLLTPSCARWPACLRPPARPPRWTSRCAPSAPPRCTASSRRSWRSCSRWGEGAGRRTSVAGRA